MSTKHAPVSKSSADSLANMNDFLAKIVCHMDNSTTRRSPVPMQRTMNCKKIQMEGKEFTVEEICHVLRNNIGVILDTRPRNLHQRMLHKRLSSLESWKGRTKKTISNTEIARAGFYHDESSDCLRCFHCLVKLTSRGTRNDIWEEHAELFPFCAHVRQCKGDTFIENVLTESNEQELWNAINLVEEEHDSSNGQCATMSMIHDKSSHADNDVTSPNDLSVILEENTRMSNNILCKVCWEEQCSIIIVPCSHFSVCGQCLAALDKCPLCRSEVKGTIRAQLA
ncbi:hypothetical protein DPMN_070861 [Dreissena polymorpha]|uniref:RING-type domain-containing protein n=1 Tax=Dreissena polymorpha TaxID=45954 RepID=A0A9D3Z5Y1_DREPO|nr:hypothetical protein DPMN_070861 [Dreissena polymorpha]